MSEPVTIEVMGEQFTIKCSPEQKANLIKAAALVHETMKKIDEQGTGLNRIAVMAALNIANDAITGSADMATKIRTEYDVELDLLEVQKKLETIHNQVENSLTSNQDLKLQ